MPPTESSAHHPAVPLGRQVAELTDEELEQQGKNAHDTRNWVFLNGTAGQFATHTARMLELEQEYLRRHPKRTWQGSGGSSDGVSDLETLKHALRGIVAQMEVLLAETANDEPSQESAADPVMALLTRIAAEPSGRMHKLEVHQLAREVGLERADLARMYTAEPPLLLADHHDRVVAPAGHALIANPDTSEL